MQRYAMMTSAPSAKVFFDQDASGEWVRAEDALALEAENARLKAALRLADEAIASGQGCRSESEFVRWMRKSQHSRPPASLLEPQP